MKKKSILNSKMLLTSSLLLLTSGCFGLPSDCFGSKDKKLRKGNTIMDDIRDAIANGDELVTYKETEKGSKSSIKNGNTADQTSQVSEPKFLNDVEKNNQILKKIQDNLRLISDKIRNTLEDVANEMIKGINDFSNDMSKTLQEMVENNPKALKTLNNAVIRLKEVKENPEALKTRLKETIENPKFLEVLKQIHKNQVDEKIKMLPKDGNPIVVVIPIISIEGLLMVLNQCIEENPEVLKEIGKLFEEITNNDKVLPVIEKLFNILMKGSIQMVRKLKKLLNQQVDKIQNETKESIETVLELLDGGFLVSKTLESMYLTSTNEVEDLKKEQPVLDLLSVLKEVFNKTKDLYQSIQANNNEDKIKETLSKCTKTYYTYMDKMDKYVKILLEYKNDSKKIDLETIITYFIASQATYIHYYFRMVLKEAIQKLNQHPNTIKSIPG